MFGHEARLLREAVEDLRDDLSDLRGQLQILREGLREQKLETTYTRGDYRQSLKALTDAFDEFVDNVARELHFTTKWNHDEGMEESPRRLIMKAQKLPRLVAEAVEKAEAQEAEAQD